MAQACIGAIRLGCGAADDCTELSRSFKNVIFDYPLGRAMADGFVKEPAVVRAKTSSQLGSQQRPSSRSNSKTASVSMRA